MTKRIKPFLAWAIIVDGKPDFFCEGEDNPEYTLFKTKKAALENVWNYSPDRIARVRISEVTK